MIGYSSGGGEREGKRKSTDRQAGRMLQQTESFGDTVTGMYNFAFLFVE
jgi:hypothetical protein